MFINFRDIIHARLVDMQERLTLVRANVSKQDLYSTYLENFKPEDNPIFRTNTVHDCNTDRGFLNAIGNIVGIAEDNTIETLWDVKVPDMYQPSVDALHNLVVNAHINAPMCWHSAKLGEKSNISVSPNSLGETFHHLYGELHSRYVTEDSAPIIGEVNTERQTFLRVVTELSIESLETTLDLINQNLLERGEVSRPKLERIIKLHKEYNALPEDKKAAYSWRMAVTNKGYLPRFSSAILVATKDIEDGTGLVDVVNKYNSSVVGATYQRVSAVVSAAQVKTVQKFLTENDYMDGLEKRHAKSSDMSINDVLYAAGSVKFKDTNVFDELLEDTLAREGSSKVGGTPISFDSFINNVVPDAKNISLFLEPSMKGNLCNIISQKVAGAKSVHPWGNGSSWSYNGDKADAVMERVKAAGGVHDADNCLTLHWDYTDDLDIHLETPEGKVYHGVRRKSGAELDVDMNVHGESTSPVENIFFANGVPSGKYRLSVHNYTRRSSGQGFGIRVAAGGEITNYSYDKVVANQAWVQCLTFTGHKGKITDIKLEKGLVSTGGTKEEMWGLKSSTYVPVDMVMLSPNFWEGKRHGHKHYMFMLRDCKNPESVRSFYNEQLCSELKPHRKVLEYIGGRLRVDYSDEQMAGVGFSESKPREVNLKVVTKSGRTQYYNVKT